MLRKVDRAGVLDLEGIDPIDALTSITGLPMEVAAAGWERLLHFKVVEIGANCIIFPKYIEAQESSMDPNTRQRESRERRRERLRAGIAPEQRAGVVYFLQAENGGPIKIGFANDLAKRVVGLQTSHPEKLVVLAAAQGDPEIERQVQIGFVALRERGEWFKPHQSLVTFANFVAQNGPKAWESIEKFTVTCRDQSQIAPGHELRPVTPSRAVLSRTVPFRENGGAPVKKSLWENWLFDVIIPAYPEHRRGSGLPQARAWVNDNQPDDALRTRIFASVKEWSASPYWQREEGRFVDGIGLFFTNEKWNSHPKKPDVTRRGLG
jgi:hypothetical protein